MTEISKLGPVSTYVHKRIEDLLNKYRVVVWYDSDQVFSELLGYLNLQGCVIVSSKGSRLRARREADAVYRHIDDGDGSPKSHQNLLIYVPSSRGATPEEQQQDPFEGFAHCGRAFGDQEGEHLLSLARLALPDRIEEITQLFRDSIPTLTLLDELQIGMSYPLIRQLLGIESPVEIVVAILGEVESIRKLEGITGSIAEFKRLAQNELGLNCTQIDSWPELYKRLSTYLLVSELAFDLPNGLPDELQTVAHAASDYQQHIIQICARLRESNRAREAYLRMATNVERDLRLSTILNQTTPLGLLDTFSCQEGIRINALVQAALKGDLTSSVSLLSTGVDSIWRKEPERALLWQAAQRCISFMELAIQIEVNIPVSHAKKILEAYIASDGLWRLDRAQRLYEYASAQCTHDDTVEPLIRSCRTRYLALIERIQSVFQTAVQHEGWPIEGFRRQTQTFDTYITPELVLRHKVAYFLVDSLRYEMGQDLAEALKGMGSVHIEGTTAVLPTTTRYGMAALMPGADGAFTVIEQGGELVPTIGGNPLSGVNERKSFLTMKYGDRYSDITLERLLSTSAKDYIKLIGQADLVVIRTQDIDALGEGPSLYRARRVISEVIGDLKNVANRLATVGFQTLVFAADHGHILVPEISAGDVLSSPPGEWKLKTRRSLLGQSQSTSPGILCLPAQHMGILGPIKEYATAQGYRVFRADEGYFHEGLSLQECVVPVVTVQLARQQLTVGGEEVTIAYRSDRFTSYVVGLKILLKAMFTHSLSIRLEAFDGTGPKAKSIGYTGDCDARDPSTGEINLQADVETQVPLLIDPAFHGPSVEVRAIDPRTGAILHRLKLKNARME